MERELTANPAKTEPRVSRPLFRQGRVVMLLVASLVLSVAFLVFQFRTFLENRDRPPPLQKLFAVVDFTVEDQTGRTLILSDLGRKVWVADFIFTHCSGTCPVMTGRMWQLQEALRRELSNEELQRVRLVSFSVDPERDTVDRLAEYARTANADPALWRFVTGEKGEVARVAVEGFKLGSSVTGGQGSEEIFHSSKFALVDGQGIVRGYYEGMPGDREASLDTLVRDVRRLLAELR